MRGTLEKKLLLVIFRRNAKQDLTTVSNLFGGISESWPQLVIYYKNIRGVTTVSNLWEECEDWPLLLIIE